jgi:hypothetical protein
MTHRLLTLVLALLLGMGAAPKAAADPPEKIDATEASDEASDELTLAAAPKVEKLTLEKLLDSPSWTKRAIGVMRLQRYTCGESEQELIDRLDDHAWQVRAFAIQTLACRRIQADRTWFDDEQDPRVLRTALRFRYAHAVDMDRLKAITTALGESTDTSRRMLAIELGAASRNRELTELATKAAKKLILNLTRADAGSLSPRLETLVGVRGLRTPYRWRNWMHQQGRSFELNPGYMIEESSKPVGLSLIATLDGARFAALEDYIAVLNEREVDLAICLDCTASMSGELSAAQAGVDDLMLFVGDVVKHFNFALVGYRDRRDRDFEVKGWNFTDDRSVARTWLWQLSADGGGDTPEAVHPAMKWAHNNLTWNLEHETVLIVVGDAPPHVGLGSPCEAMTRKAAELGLTTHTIQAAGKDVKHFKEIAEAGERPVREPRRRRRAHRGDRGPDHRRRCSSRSSGSFFLSYLRVCR